MMKNLEQKRAAHALMACRDPQRFKTRNGADVTKSIASMVRDSGLLPVMAFALENNDPAYKEVFKAFIEFRKPPSIVRVSLKEYLLSLSKADAAMLKYVTSEFMAYIAYLRRFANIGE